jgi:Zn-dependent protease with chaperone function
MKRKIAFAMLMGIITTGIISFTLIGINLGFSERFLATWLKSWMLGYLVVVPAILIIGPLVQKLVDRIFDAPPLVPKEKTYELGLPAIADKK